MSVEYMAVTRRRYEKLGYEQYQWARSETAPPWQPLAKPLKDARIGVVASAGVYVAGQVAYHYKDDDSIRAIPKGVQVSTLRFAHVTEHLLGDARRDPNCLFPIDALRRLEGEGFIGELADPLWSCMGGIYSQRRVRDNLAPRLARELKSQKVDAALLIPLCPICHQSMALVARHLESEGISTVCVVSALDIVRSVNPPRATFLDYPLGHTAGRPGDPEEQYGVARRSLGALETMATPGTIDTLPYTWSRDEQWKRDIVEKDAGDLRPPRDGTPRYQTDEDRKLAEQALAR
jgi:glycine/betaine/sarcosine/D-proline reductase family selenoprotein B